MYGYLGFNTNNYEIATDASLNTFFLLYLFVLVMMIGVYWLLVVNAGAGVA